MNEKHLELCSSAEWAEAVRQWIIPEVMNGLDTGDDVLEVGPGPGRTTEVLVGLVPRLTAVEYDGDLAAALAARLGDKGVEVLHGDATDLPYPDGRFSTVLSFTMLHHLPTVEAQDKLFSEAARVLRPGGAFAGRDSLDGPDFRELHIGDVCMPIDPALLEERLVRAGFDDVTVETNEWGFHFRARTPV
ncbi:MAG: class I SAM-dependent methyltransferase [Acidimicrobiales bacterium]